MFCPRPTVSHSTRRRRRATLDRAMEGQSVEGRFAVQAKTGDRIVVESAHVGQPRREGEVLEVVPSGREHEREYYRVRWDDGHESIYFPSSDCRVVGSRPGSAD